MVGFEFFTKCSEVKVDPDKPLEGARLAALQVNLSVRVFCFCKICKESNTGGYAVIGKPSVMERCDAARMLHLLLLRCRLHVVSFQMSLKDCDPFLGKLHSCILSPGWKNTAGPDASSTDGTV